MATPGYTILDGGYSGGKMCRAAGEFWARFEEKYVVDPGRYYGIQIRVRQNANPGSIGKVYAGFVSRAVDGVTLVDKAGTNADRYTGSGYSQFFGEATLVAVDADWHLYQWFWRGKASPGTDGGAFASPGKFHTNTFYVSPIVGVNVGDTAETATTECDLDIVVVKEQEDESGITDIALEFPTVRATANAAAAAAASAQEDADAANAALAAISNDGILTPAEKGAVVRDYRALSDEKADTDSKADAAGVSRAAYDSAITALQAYMVSLGLSLGVNEAEWGATQTTIDGATFRSKFATAYLERAYLLNAITAAARSAATSAASTASAAELLAESASDDAAAAQATADTAATNATTALGKLDDIANDGKLTPGEKRAVITQAHDLADTKSALDTKADLFSVSRSAYDSAINGLVSYLSSLSLTLNSNEATWQTTTTSITASAFRSYFAAAYTERTNLLNAIASAQKTLADNAQSTANSAASAASAAASAASAAQVSADTANAALADIASDSKLTAAEKRAVIQDAHDLADAKTGLDAQADAFSVSRTAYDTAIADLTSYLGGLGLTLNSNEATWQTTTTAITGSTFRSKFAAAYSARQSLLNAIEAKAKALADAAQGSATSAGSAAAAAQSTADAAASAASAAQSTADTASAAAAAAQSTADSATTSAATANAALADFASDDVLSAGEKPAIVQDYSVITTEQAGIDAQAASYGVTSQKTAYDSAVSALTSYLGTLSSPVAWNNLTNKTNLGTGGGATFRTKFADVYTSRQAVLDAIVASAKSRAADAQTAADAAQGAADAAQAAADAAAAAASGAQSTADAAASAASAAQSTADSAATAAAAAQSTANSAASSAATANAAIADIAADDVLTPGEKATVIRDYSVITTEQTGIDGQATAYSITTEKTAYDSAVTALTTYLGTLTSPTAWNDTSGKTTITGTTLRSKFADVYTSRQALLNAIYASAKSRAAAAQTAADVAQAAADAAQDTADAAQSAADTAQTTANTATTSITGSKIFWYDWDDAPYVGRDGVRIIGDQWQQKQADGTRKILKWTGSGWDLDLGAVPLLKAAEADIADIKAELVTANGFAVNGFAEAGGSVTAGARLYNPADASKPCLDIAPSGLRIGGTKVSEAWFASSSIAAGTFAHTGSGTTDYSGDITGLSQASRTWNGGTFYCIRVAYPLRFTIPGGKTVAPYVTLVPRARTSSTAGQVGAVHVGGEGTTGVVDIGFYLNDGTYTAMHWTTYTWAFDIVIMSFLTDRSVVL